MREVELKLEIDRDDVSRLQRSPRLRELGDGRGSTRSLHSVYFDTRELALAARGIALRVRRDGRRRVQTLKARGAEQGAHFDRIEYEAPTSRDEPDLALVPDPQLRARVVEALAGAPLEPVIETRIRRTRRLLRYAGASVELDLDLGEVRAAGETQPLCEVELELREGEPGALYELALELLEVVPLRISAVSKADLGLAVLTGEPPAPRKAPPFALDPEATLDEAMAATLGACLAQVLANQAPAQLGQDLEGVHQMRVGLRRLRSALRLYRPMLPLALRRPLERELRWLGHELGAVRDLDVFVVELLGPLVALRPDDKGLDALKTVAQAARVEQQEALRGALHSPRFTKLVLEIGRFVARRSWRSQPLDERSARLFAPARDLAALLLDRRDAKVRQVGARVEELELPQLHRLRIQVKRLRYAVELLGSLFPGRRRERYQERLPELQDRLGRLADLATAQRLLALLIERVDAEARPACARAAGFVEGWAAADVVQATRRLARPWRRFAHTRPFWTQD
jgi:triphosphatase